LIIDWLEEWFKGVLIDGIIGNLSGLFDTVNTKVGEIAADVGATPQGWNSGIFNMIRNLSESVIIPIAGAILAFVMTYELIQMVTEKNNLHDIDTFMFFKWVFKTYAAVLIVTNTWNIVMGVFDAAQQVVNQSAGVIIGNTSIDIDSLVGDLQTSLEAMSLGGLIGLWFQSLFVGLTMNILSICIMLVVYGRMIEIYLVTSLGPIPLATMTNGEWRNVGQNYLKSLLALGFQAFLIMVVVGIYSVLIQSISAYITYTIEADNLKAARARLSRISLDIQGYFKIMGAVSRVLDGKERLEVLHGIMHPDGERFNFDWKWLAAGGLSTKDFIAPSSFAFKNSRMFQMGGKLCAASFLQIITPELTDRILTDFLDTDSSLVVNVHIQALEQTEAVKMVKRKITDLDAMKIQEQKKAVRDGYDMDILPSDLATYGGAAKKLLQDLQSRNERYFLLTFLVLNYGDTKRKLENEVFRTAGVAQKHNCTLTRLDFQQERGLVSSLPLGENQIHITRGMTTSAVAIIVPFVTQELFQGGDSLYYGLNAKSGNMIMLDRKNARSPNGLVFGTPGGGKSFSCKREMIGVLLKTHDHVLVCDPEGEYAPLVRLLHGQIIKLSPTSRDYLNPLDINLNYSEDENPLALKSDFVLSLCELIMGGKTGLEAIERTVIDRGVQRIYQPYFADPRPENMPILSDLHAALTAQHLPEADRVAQALDLYVSGSLNFFNNRTTVDIDNRFVCFDIKELPKNLKKPGMLVIQDQVWNRVTRNRNTGVSTWYYADEFHLLLKEPQTAAYSAEIWKRFRKWGGVPTGATQNVKDLLSSPEIENILENSDFICMLNQAAGDRKILAERLNISPEQLKFVTNSPPGEGLLFFENVILPFADKFPRDTELYRIMSTKPSEVNGV